LNAISFSARLRFALVLDVELCHLFLQNEKDKEQNEHNRAKGSQYPQTKRRSATGKTCEEGGQRQSEKNGCCRYNFHGSNFEQPTRPRYPLIGFLFTVFGIASPLVATNQINARPVHQGRSGCDNSVDDAESLSTRSIGSELRKICPGSSLWNSSKNEIIPDAQKRVRIIQDCKC